jgi:hypothetical protein
MLQAIPHNYFAHNIEPIGYHDLNARPAFKLAMQEVNSLWYLYVAHLWHRGWSILDVTDPAAPQFCDYIAGPENTWTIQIQVADGKMITGLERIAPGWGGNEGQSYTEGFFIFDVSAPARPVRLGHFKTGSTGTHRNFYDGGNLVHAAAGASGFDFIFVPEIVNHCDEECFLVYIFLVRKRAGRLAALVPIFLVTIGVYQQRVFRRSSLRHLGGRPHHINPVSTRAMQDKHQARTGRQGFGLDKME